MILTERTLIKRINRKLQQDNYSVMKIARPGSRDEDSLGRYYLLDDRNTVIDSHCNLEDYGRDLGVLAPHDTVART